MLESRGIRVVLDVMNLKKIKNCVTTLATGTVILGSGCFLNCSKPKPLTENSTKDANVVDSLDSEDNNDANSLDGWIESRGWTITSYGNVNEALYSGEKIKIYNKSNKFLGLYSKEFLPWVKMNGSGIGDGIGNDKTQFLCYDYDINDGKTHYLINHPQGAYNNVISSWKTYKPSVAVNPPLPQGTRIRLKDLNLKTKLNHPWVENLLLSKTFHADDRFFLPEAERSNKKIDIYVGIIKFKDYTPANYQALFMKDATVLIEQPSLDLNKDGVLNNLDIQTFQNNWLKEDKTQYIQGDLNYDGRVDSYDRAILMGRWKKRK